MTPMVKPGCGIVERHERCGFAYRRCAPSDGSRAREVGVLLRRLAPVVVRVPPLSFLDDELDRAVDAPARAIDEVCEATDRAVAAAESRA